jgi:hypothetical protein
VSSGDVAAARLGDWRKALEECVRATRELYMYNWELAHSL